jgi:16S rRNA (uracil1498-N3)-methyltransferase
VTPRFHAPDAGRGDSPLAVLSADESHHLRHVLRLRPGDRVHVFDGRGREWEATVAESRSEGVELLLDREVVPVPEPCAAVTLALAVLRPDYMDEAVRNAAMVGVTSIQPIVTARSVRRLTGSTADRLRDRWQRLALSADKQCGRAVLPQVYAPRALADWVAATSTASSVCVVLVEPAYAPAAVPDPAAWLPDATRAGLGLLVGPEGGWTVGEVEGAVAEGFTPWTISPRILRADAVSVAALSILFYAWERRNAANSQLTPPLL